MSDIYELEFKIELLEAKLLLANNKIDSLEKEVESLLRNIKQLETKTPSTNEDYYGE